MKFHRMYAIIVKTRLFVNTFLPIILSLVVLIAIFRVVYLFKDNIKFLEKAIRGKIEAHTKNKILLFIPYIYLII